MNHANGCPTAQSITAATVNDIDRHHLVQPEKGATYVFDKGCCDDNRWAEPDNAGACSVTRLKANAAVQVVERIMPSENPNTDETILADEYIRFKHKNNSSRPNHYHGKTLRRITVKREDKAPLVLGSVDNQQLRRLLRPKTASATLKTLANGRHWLMFLPCICRFMTQNPLRKLNVNRPQ